MIEDKLNKMILKLFGKEEWQKITIPAFLILLSFLLAAIIILILGQNPLRAFYNLLQGSGLAPKANYAAYKSMLTDFLSFLNFMTPMIFAALAVAVALKGGLFNIGVSGQMLFAGFFATVIVGYSGLGAFLAKPLVLLVGIIAGGIVGGTIGLLKHKFNINEVVSSIMLNYIFQYIFSFFIHAYYVDPVSRQSQYISDASRLTLVNVELFGLRMDISIGFILAIILAIAFKRFMDNSRLGFEIKAVGANHRGANYAGINVGRTRVLTMVLSGAFAGLAGVTYFLGYYASIQPRVLPNMGFDAIAVALLGNIHAYGILAASFIISIIDQGSTYMSSSSGVRHEIASVITGLILLFSASSAYIQYKIRNRKDRLASRARKENE